MMKIDQNWFPHGHVVSMWTQHDYHVDTMEFPGGHHMISMWTQHDFTTWFQHGLHMVSTLTPNGSNLETT